MPTYTVLVLVRDAQVASAIRKSTEFANPSLRVLTAETGGEAHAILQRELVSLAITILPVRTGFEFVAIASERFPHMPQIAASCSQAGELDEVAIRLMDLLEHQDEEMQVDRLAVSLVETLILQRVSSGFLRAISLLDTIRLLEAESSTSTLTLRQPKTNVQGVLFFRNGRLLDAHTTMSGGVSAAKEVLEWTDVHISISSGCREIEQRINKPVSQLLSEWLAEARKSALSEAEAPTPPAATEPTAEDPEPSATAPARQPSLRDLLATQEIEFRAAAEVPQAPEQEQSAKAEERQNPVALRLMETVDYDLDALRHFSAETGGVPPAPAPPKARINVGELIEQGFACYRQKDYEGAVRLWEQAKSAGPDNKALNYNLKLAHAKVAT